MGNSDLLISGLPAPDLLGALGVGMPKGPRRPEAGRNDKALRQAAKDFESVLLHKLLEEMQNTIPESGLAGSGTTKQLHGLFWTFLAKDIADKGGLGLWKDLYSQWAGSADGKEKAASTEQSP
ncbi:MAG: hypothetical protein WBF17_23260 [Phycisphaerae bacterium]